MKIVILAGLATLSGTLLLSSSRAGVVELYEEGNYGLSNCTCLIRVYLHQIDANGERRVQFLGDLVRGRHRLRLQAPPGHHDLIVVVEPADEEATPAETRTIARLRPNVSLEVLPDYVTRVRIGIAGGLEQHPFDRRTGPEETSRRTGLRPPHDFESPNASRFLPASSRFSTELEVSDPIPLAEER